LSKDEIELCYESFPSLLKYFMEHGHIPDDVFKVHGIPDDINSSGSKVKRTAGIANELSQRAKCLSHEFQRRLRKEREENIRDMQIARNELKFAQHRQKIEFNKRCEAAIKQQLPPENDNFEAATLQMFLKPLARELEAFIMARDSIKKRATLKNGSLSQAESGEMTLVTVAHALRMKPPLEVWEEEASNERNDSIESMQSNSVMMVIASRCRMEDLYFTATQSWLEDVKLALDPLQAHQWKQENVQVLNDEAKILYQVLWNRLDSHIKSQVHDASKHEHWVWRFVYSNLSRVAIMMVFVGHVNIECLDGAMMNSNKCLLFHPSACNNFLPLTGSDQAKRLEGSYLFHDPQQGVWIRSGKNTGRPFEERLQEHKRASQLKDDISLTSNFYRSYPSTTAQKMPQRLGTHKQLCAYSALAYSCAYDHPGRNLLTETDKEGGTLFCWSTETIFRVHKLSFRNSSQKMKQLHMVSYLFELCYDLALSRHFNVSENPGFEVPLGLGGSKNTTAL
jgi:hypothetical protein